MLTIRKYPFPMADVFHLDLPRGAAVLSAQFQGDTPYLWALVDIAAPEESVEFRVFGTGHHVDVELGRLGYIATLQSGPFVRHVFRVAGAGGKVANG